MSRIGVILALLIIAVAQVHAATVSLRVASPEVYVGEQFVIEVLIQDAGDAPSPRLESDVFDIQSASGPMDRSSRVVVNGRVIEDSKTVAYVFIATASEPGTHPLGPAEVTVGGTVHRSNQVSMRVKEPEKLDDPILLVELSNKSPYVGEPVEMVVTLLQRREVVRGSFSIPRGGDRIRTYPGSTDARFSQVNDRFQFMGENVTVMVGRTEFEATEYRVAQFRRMIVPQETGRLSLGEMIFSGDQSRPSRSFFDRGLQRVVIPSDPIELDVRPLPESGRPSNFNGLVGEYTVHASVMPQEVRVGDPMTLTVHVLGPLPQAVPDDVANQDAVASGFRVSENEPPKLTESSRVFTWTIRATNADVESFPSIDLPHFDPASGEYRIARSREIPLKVLETEVVDVSDVEGMSAESAAASLEGADGGIRHNYRGEAALAVAAGADIQNAMWKPIAAGAICLPPVACVAIGLVGVVQQRRKRDDAGRRRRRALAALSDHLRDAERSEDGFGEIAAAIMTYFAAITGRAASAITPRDCIELVGAIDANAAQRLEQVLNRCDAARFGGADSGEVAQTATQTREIIASIDSKVRNA
ncbi:MAG: BatD family protein [Phycisphaerales bacterium]